MRTYRCDMGLGGDAARFARWVAMPLFLAACTTSMPPGSRVTPRAARLSDEVMIRDHAVFDSLALAVSARAYSVRSDDASRARAVAYVALARDAYERNDEGTLVTQLLDVATGVRPSVPHSRSAALWALVDSLGRTAAPPSEQARLQVALESALVRAEYTILGAPSCAQWAQEAERTAQALRRLTPSPVVARAPARAEPPRPAPAPTPVVVPTPTPVAAPKELPRDVPRLVPNRVHFALDQSALSVPTQRVLNELADSLKQYPGVRLVLEGHTDPRASVEYNAALSRRRVTAVERYLVDRGADPKNIRAEALGKSQLERADTSITSLARNRRVTLRYFTRDGKEIPGVNQFRDLQEEVPGAKAAAKPAVKSPPKPKRKVAVAKRAAATRHTRAR